MMDPLGLSLENFDMVGRWRDVDEALVPIDASGALPDGTKFDGPAGLRAVLMSHPDRFVQDRHRENADLRARPRARALRHAGGAQNRARRGEEQLPCVVVDCRRRQQSSLPDAEAAVMIITKMALPRRTFLRGIGAAFALPLLDAMVPAFVGGAKKRRQARHAAWDSSTCRTAWR